jgi:hypothetical protein
MRLLRFAEVETSPSDRFFYHSRPCVIVFEAARLCRQTQTLTLNRHEWNSSPSQFCFGASNDGQINRAFRR